MALDCTIFQLFFSQMLVAGHKENLREQFKAILTKEKNNSLMLRLHEKLSTYAAIFSVNTNTDLYCF